MRCTSCGQSVKEGAHFCEYCGAPLYIPDNRRSYPLETDSGPGRLERENRRTTTREEDPYKDRITQLRLQIRQLRLELKRVRTGMSNTRSQYNETAAFVPRGLLHKGYKWLEDLRLLGPQQQKQGLQEEILTLEQELIRLQQAQAEWKARQ